MHMRRAVEDLMSGMAMRLRLIHGVVGIAQHLFRGSVIERAKGDADTRADEDLMPMDFDR